MKRSHSVRQIRDRSPKIEAVFVRIAVTFLMAAEWHFYQGKLLPRAMHRKQRN